MDLQIKRTEKLFFAGSVVCAIFSLVYEYFSHQVYSSYMIFAFLIPLILGAIPYHLMTHIGKMMPNQVSRTIYNSGVVVLTFGCLFAGILEIYGTTNRLLLVYPVMGTILIILGLTLYIVSIIKQSTVFCVFNGIHMRKID